MKTTFGFGLLTAISMTLATIATHARAARLVVLAVNSGIDTTAPYINTQPPNLPPPGAKGFLIGVDLQDSLVDVPLAVRLDFQNVIHQQGVLDEVGDPYPTPINIKTRSQASLQETLDGVAMNGYRRSDSYVMDNAQQAAYVWTPVGPGFIGGEPGDDFLNITASLGLPSAIDGPGPVQLVYIVATGDVPISGLIARGQVGFDPIGFPVDSISGIFLSFDKECIGFIRASDGMFCTPEPSTLALGGIGLIGLALSAWKRRGKRQAGDGK